MSTRGGTTLAPGIGNRRFALSDAQEHLLTQNLGLVQAVISRMSRKANGSLIRRLGDCAVSAGMVALARAAESYRPDQGAKFSTYSTSAIVRAVLEEANRTFGPNGCKVGADGLDPSQFQSGLMPPDEQLIEREDADDYARRVERVRKVCGDVIPSTYKSAQTLAKRYGLSGSGSADELFRRVALTIAERLA